MSSDTPSERYNNFLREIIKADIEASTYGGRVATRFPPEPNGYPHMGHACTICLNFGLAEEFDGTCNLRYDDTNPDTESDEYVAAMEDAVRWLGFTPDKICFASDYFEQFYDWAVGLIEKGLAYVDSQSTEDIRKTRGTVTEPGVNSPYRERPTEESLRLLDEMRRGEHPDGSHVLRAKIDMAHPNMLMRDPLMYRIRRNSHHYRRGDSWSIYPLYDWAHGQGDAVEDITHSICTLEFDVHRPLYNWFLDAIGIPEPRNRQYEFARFNLDYTVMSKRKLLRLVEEGHVNGWNDPRMPTIAAQRRRGVRPEAIRSFFSKVGITKVDGSTDIAFYEHAIRDDLNHVAPRILAVSRPLKMVVENYSEGDVEWLDAPYWPHDVTPPAGAPTTRRLPLTREVWIEQDDFSEEPPMGWKRLSPGEKVRLRHGPIVRCTSVEKDEHGAIRTVRVEAVSDGDPGKVKGVIHWVSAEHAIPAQFRLYDRLFSEPHPDERDDFLDALNPDSLVETSGFVEPSVADEPPDTRYQFERLGYFWQDPEDSAPDALVFNRIVSLRDSWKKKETPKHSPPSKGESPKATGDVQPHDPAAGLTDEQRTQFDDLVSRGVGEEEAAVIVGETDLTS
ncbi:MAG: glutamine--tRNA ligase/YqeY domain fusion protein, partial [Rubricoccaceae bacterium]|nr:glutamine--tRNA ligase/YqeY domain fusion protein [Rubricoccaceae bacterium]